MVGVSGRSNLYRDPDGNAVKGRYVYLLTNKNKYSAQCKYPEGYCKASSWDTLEDAINWVDSHWDTYKNGFFYDIDGTYRRLRRNGEPRVYEQGGAIAVPES